MKIQLSPPRLRAVLFAALAPLGALICAPSAALAGGTLTPLRSTHQPIQIRSREVHVTINNGFAQTDVRQTFFNPNTTDLEAIYAFPVPKSASLSAVTIVSGEKTIEGEVLPKADAEQAYAEEKTAGNDAGLATKEAFQTYHFKVSPVRARKRRGTPAFHLLPAPRDRHRCRPLCLPAGGGRHRRGCQVVLAARPESGARSVAFQRGAEIRLARR